MARLYTHSPSRAGYFITAKAENGRKALIDIFKNKLAVLNLPREDYITAIIEEKCRLHMLDVNEICLELNRSNNWSKTDEHLSRKRIREPDRLFAMPC